MRSVKEEDEEALNGDFEGWDDATDPEGLVWDYVKHEETRRSMVSLLCPLCLIDWCA